MKGGEAETFSMMLSGSQFYRILADPDQYPGAERFPVRG